MDANKHVLEGPLVFVDIETNGLSHVRGRVIEVAAIRVEAGQVVSSFQSLLNPGTPLPQFITNLTGITNNDVQTAPVFADIAAELSAVLEGAVFVAHNVRFDYSFLKQEFGRLGRSFLPKQLCTVKLSRALYPMERGHKLADLIGRHGFRYQARHRAYDDAAILWQFIRHIEQSFPPEIIAEAIGRQLRQPALPKQLTPALVRNLPEGPGVYIFEDEAGRPLYVGKSVTIKKRVLSHFGRDHAEAKEFKIAQNIAHIRTEQTAGELTALLRESELVKELQPIYNRQLRKLEKLLILKAAANADGYLTLKLEEADQLTPDELQGVLAIYPRRGRARQALEQLRLTYDLCPKLLGLEKSSGACFSYQLKKCRGACCGQETAAIYNVRLLTAFERQRIQTWPFAGPVLVQDKGSQLASDSPEQAIIVDQWCVLATLKQAPDCEPEMRRRAKRFDLDTYKILQAFFQSKADRLAIRPLTPQQLQSMIG